MFIFRVIVLVLATAHRWQLFQELALANRLQHCDKAHSKEVTSPLYTRINFAGEVTPSFYNVNHVRFSQTNHHPIDRIPCLRSVF